MSFPRGVDGLVHYGGSNLRAVAWNMDQAAGVEPTGDFGSSGVERDYNGVVDVTGSFTLQPYNIHDTSTGGLVDTPALDITQMFASGSTLSKARAKLIETSKAMWHGMVLITGFSRNQPSQGFGGVSLNWAADGRMTFTSSTST